jgi:hypothetical protein
LFRSIVDLPVWPPFPSHRMIAMRLLLLAAVVMAGTAPHGPGHTANSSSEFPTLIIEVCLPYSAGESTEADVVPRNYRRIRTWTWPDPPPPGHLYRGSVGGPVVSLINGRCVVHLNGRPPQGLADEVGRALAQRFGPADLRRAEVRAPRGVKRYCIGDLALSYYSDSDILLFGRPSRPGFTFEATPVDCSKLRTS